MISLYMCRVCDDGIVPRRVCCVSRLCSRSSFGLPRESAIPLHHYYSCHRIVLCVGCHKYDPGGPRAKFVSYTHTHTPMTMSLTISMSSLSYEYMYIYILC